VADGQPTILQIIPRLDTGGAELSTVEIAEAIVRAGGRALVATEGGRLAERVTEVGGEILPFPAASKNPVQMWSNSTALAALIVAEGVDLIHARSRAPAWSAWRAAHQARIPFVTTYHGAYAEQSRLKRIYNSIMVRSDIVIANSRYTSDLIRARYGTAQQRIRVIHRGVDPASFSRDAVTADRIGALRDGWRIAPDRPIILQAARLTAWKGHRVLIEAAGRLHAEGRLAGAMIVMAGDAQGRDGYVAGLKSDAARLGLGERVRFVGHVEDMPAAFAAAHVAVVASTEPEAFGRTAAEAQAVGCPVIATNIGAPPETVLAPPATPRDRATGWLVPPGDIRTLAAALTEALDLAAADHAALGDRAAAHVAQFFTLDAMKRQTLAVYDELLETDLVSRFENGAFAGQNAGKSGLSA
jgi:glycosyltransferase involved in cell wall biosynthesis